MSQSAFRFRQFEIHHDKCAMKVGTDGVLLGAWAQVDDAAHILDIGTGCGLIAIMAAQRNPRAQILGVEVDPDAFGQARENAMLSPWSNRLSMVLQDVRSLTEGHFGFFDCILCNPPYFLEDTLSPDPSRALARNESCLSFEDLLLTVSRVLSSNGTLSVILPFNVSKIFITSALNHSLFLSRRCVIRTVEHKLPRRVLLTFCREMEGVQEENLVLQNPDGSRTVDYEDLTEDFYLW